MRRFAFAFALFALACHVAAQQPPAKPKTDLETIHGSWWIVGLESGGKAQSDKGFKGNTFTFRKNKKGIDTATLAERPYEPVDFSFALDAKASPKTIDLTTRGNTAHGIYKLEGDDLTICMGLGGSRPSEFATRAGGDTEIFRLRRNRWERYSDLVGFGFSVDFPGKPIETKCDFDMPSGKAAATVLTVRSEMDRVSYSVTVIPLPDKLEAMEVEEAFDAVRKAMLAEIDKDASPKVEPASPLFKAPAAVSAAREFTIAWQPPRSKDRDTLRVRLYVSGERLYVLAVGGPDELAKSQNVLWFWNSFRTPTDKRKDFPSK